MSRHAQAERIMAELRDEAGGSFVILYRALQEEARDKGSSRRLDASSVKRRIRRRLEESGCADTRDGKILEGPK